MSEKRKPEDVVLDEGAFDEATSAYARTGRDVYRASMRVSFRTYIAEADLIPRPQTVEEWAGLMPESVWDGTIASSANIIIEGFHSGENLWRHGISIPRPRPPRMTDEEIDVAARNAAGVALANVVLSDADESVSNYQLAQIAIDAYRDRLARLEKERGDE